MKDLNRSLYDFKYRNSVKSYCKRHDIVPERTLTEALEEMGRFYASLDSDSDDTVLNSAWFFEKNGFIYFSKVNFYDAFSRIELTCIVKLEVERRAVYACLNEVNKVVYVEIIFGDRTLIKRIIL